MKMKNQPTYIANVLTGYRVNYINNERYCFDRLGNIIVSFGY